MKSSARLVCISIALISIGSLATARQPADVDCPRPGTVIDLGTLGGSSSQANAINSSGGIAGVASLSGDVAQEAFFVAPESNIMQDLGALTGGTNSTATALNREHEIVGYSDYLDPVFGTVTNAFLYKRGSLIDIGTLGGPTSQATGISERGQVVGFSLLSDNATMHGFLYNSRENTMTDLGTLAGGSNSAAYGVNDLGIAAGSSETGMLDAFGSPIVDAVIFNPCLNKVVDLGNLGASPAQATGINDRLAVVGFSMVADGTTHGFFWHDGKFKDVGNLGGSYTQPNAINSFDEVVGFSNITGDTDTHAFIWTARKGIVDLNTLLPANSGWVLNAAYGVNATGEIVGVGVHNGESHAFAFSYRRRDD